jgi:hypothetical protein
MPATPMVDRRRLQPDHGRLQVKELPRGQKLMPHALVNVSYCQSHRKGGDSADAMHLPGAEHALWLKDCVLHLLATQPYPVVVSATGFRGLLHVEAGFERDALWQLHEGSDAVRFLGHADNPGHQGGAATALRLGLEAAHKWGYAHLVHTAEDVVPAPGAVEAIVDALASGNDYAGEAWAGDQLNAQFFGVRVTAVVGAFDPGVAAGTGCLEAYLAGLLRGQRLDLRAGRYQHSHDHATWTRWAEEAR